MVAGRVARIVVGLLLLGCVAPSRLSAQGGPRTSRPTGRQADQAGSSSGAPAGKTLPTGKQTPWGLPGPGAPAAADLTLADPVWVSPSKHKENDGIVRLTVKSTGYAGPVRVQVYQSAVLPEGPRGRTWRVMGPAVTVMLEAGGSSPAEVHVSSAPSRLGRLSAYHVVAEAKGKFNLLPLRVSDETALSVELDAADPLGDPAPLADTPQDRVFLWLRRHRELIREKAGKVGPGKDRSIPPEAIAGAIAWEALFNPATIRTYQGPGKVHFDDDNAAAQVEKVNYMPAAVLGSVERLTRVRDTRWAVRYIAAILGVYADLAEKAGSRADIRHRPEILVTLYNGITFDRALIPTAKVYPAGRNRTDIRPANASAYFEYKVKHGDSFAPSETGRDGVIGMGKWVKDNADFLSRALSDP